MSLTWGNLTLYLLSTSSLAQLFLYFGILLSSVASLTFLWKLIRKCDAELRNIRDIQCYARVFRFGIYGQSHLGQSHEAQSQRHKGFKRNHNRGKNVLKQSIYLFKYFVSLISDGIDIYRRQIVSFFFKCICIYFVYAWNFVCLGTYLLFSIQLKVYTKNQGEVVDQTNCNCWAAQAKPKRFFFWQGCSK